MITPSWWTHLYEFRNTDDIFHKQGSSPWWNLLYRWNSSDWWLKQIEEIYWNDKTHHIDDNPLMNENHLDEIFNLHEFPHLRVLYYVNEIWHFDKIHSLGKLIIISLFLSHKFIVSNTLIKFINMMKLTILINYTNWEFHYVDDEVHHLDQIPLLVEVDYLTTLMTVKQLIKFL